MKRADKLRQLSLTTREAKAAELLDIDTVMALAAKAASQGAETLRLTVEIPADIRDTLAAKTLEKILKREGFSLSWESRAILGKHNPTGTDLTVCDPIIRWDDHK